MTACFGAVNLLWELVHSPLTETIIKNASSEDIETVIHVIEAHPPVAPKWAKIVEELRRELELRNNQQQERSRRQRGHGLGD